MSETTHRATMGSALAYQDPNAALEWLQKAFGFEPTLVITDDDGKIQHSEMSCGESYIMVGGEWAENIKSPRSIGGTNTQTVHVQLKDGIDAHCEHARAAGAVILGEPEDQFYGNRTYRALDPEGHMWSFGQTVKVVPESEWEAASGLKVRSSI